jgi:hypothetical protein
MKIYETTFKPLQVIYLDGSIAILTKCKNRYHYVVQETTGNCSFSGDDSLKQAIASIKKIASDYNKRKVQRRFSVSAIQKLLQSLD